MKPLFWIGLIVLVLGIASFFVPIPRQERHGVKVGDESIGITTRSDEKVPVIVGLVLIVGGIGLMAVGGKRP
jgi:hypothetical protein